MSGERYFGPFHGVYWELRRVWFWQARDLELQGWVVPFGHPLKVRTPILRPMPEGFKP